MFINLSDNIESCHSSCHSIAIIRFITKLLYNKDSFVVDTSNYISI